MTTKLTLLTLYLRIFKHALWTLWAVWLGIGLTIVFYMSTFIGYLGLCVRSDKPVWVTIQQQPCADNLLLIGKAQNIFGLISDLYILAIPLWLVWGLSMSSKRKLGVMGIFLTGGA